MRTIDAERVGKIANGILGCSRFAVAAHIHPDGDAAGSLLALTFMLRKLGKEAHAYCQDPALPSNDFLPGAREIRLGGLNPDYYDAAVLVDCGDLHRVGPYLARLIPEIPLVMNIDHHVNLDPFGDLHWVDPQASSTCEMLFDLAKALGIALDGDIATQLYTGILTDTGSFRYSNTTDRVLAVASQLAGAGADPARIAAEVYESAPPERLRLHARVLGTLIFSGKDRLATAELTQAMLSETRASASDGEGFVNDLRGVGSVRMAILFREEEGGLVHVSTRSKGEVDVAAFARAHGGGGHRHAAAFRVAGAVSVIRARVTAEALEYLA